MKPQTTWTVPAHVIHVIDGDTLECDLDRYTRVMTIPPRRRPDLAERNRARHTGPRLYEDRAWMLDAYATRRLSLRAMAAEAECGLRTIARWMETHRIPTRTLDEAYELIDRSGAANPRWKGGLPRCACGAVKSRGTATCQTCRPRTGADGSNWRGDTVGYAGAHGRVKTLRGSATDHACDRCGSPAHEWAYDGTDPGPLFEGVMAYSADPNRYRPMCRSCHKKMDAARRRAELLAARGMPA